MYFSVRLKLQFNVLTCKHAGLRALQSRRELEELVKQVKATRDRMRWGPEVRK